MSNSFIYLRSGGRFSFDDPYGSDLTIEDIAHSLARLCRFTGHVDFYSVAQHSVLVSYAVPPEHALAGLLHDSAEALMGDLATPLKALLPDYKALEHRVEEAVLSRFGLSLPLDPSIKLADKRAVRTEFRDLMPQHRITLDLLAFSPLPITITPLPSEDAEAQFMARYRELTALDQTTQPDMVSGM